MSPAEIAQGAALEAQLLIAELLGMLTAAGVAIWVVRIVARRFSVKA